MANKSKKKKSVAKKTVVSKNENRVAKALNDLRSVLSDPALAKILADLLVSTSKKSAKKNEDMPVDVLGHMVPMVALPAPINAAPEVVEPSDNSIIDAILAETNDAAPEASKAPTIIVEDRIAVNEPPKSADDGYRGEVMEISKLAGINEPIPCEVINPDIPEVKMEWGKVAKATMPNLMILTAVNPSAIGPDAKNISYAIYKSFKSSTRDVMSALVVKRLTGQQGKKMLRLYNEFRMKNFEGSLAHEGVQIGCDPEIFVEDKKGNVIPAFEFLGSKEDTKVRSTGAHGNKKIYWDGYQAEFETRENHCLAYHIDSIQGGLEGLLLAAKAVNKDARLSTKTVIETPLELLKKTEDKFKAFACMPSLNAYGLKSKDASPNELTFRPAGGHLHFGCAAQIDKNRVVEGVKALDAVLGVACVSLFRSFDNPIRRQYYGLPGEYRLPAWGLEYRTLSSAWLIHPITAHMVFELGRKALMFGANGYRQQWIASEKEVIDTIQNCDVKKAVEILKRNETIFKRILSASALIDPFNGKTRTAEVAFNAFVNGAETIIKAPDDIESNWHLCDGSWKGHSGAKNCAWNSAITSFTKGEKV